MERARGLEPPTCSFVVNCSDSVELRPQVDLRFGMWDCGLKNPKSEIRNPTSRWRKVQDSNPQATRCAIVFRTTAITYLAYLPRRKIVRGEAKTFCSLLCWKLAGAFRFELKTSVLETGILPIETTRPFRFGIWDCGFGIEKNRKSQIENRKYLE